MIARLIASDHPLTASRQFPRPSSNCCCPEGRGPSHQLTTNLCVRFSESNDPLPLDLLLLSIRLLPLDIPTPLLKQILPMSISKPPLLFCYPAAAVKPVSLAHDVLSSEGVWSPTHDLHKVDMQ